MLTWLNELATHPALPFELHAQEDLVPTQTVALSSLLGNECLCVPSFRMDRYPVSVARYGVFVDAGGYEERDYWSEEGWWWRLEQGIVEPRWWNADEPHWGDFLRPDRPIVGISWYEAQAFCAFTQRRLPTQVQWEAAARGTQGRIYPWGHALEPGRMGNRNIGPRLTWPVGFFAQGVGPYGHLDLVGNVWQWTTDMWPKAEEATTIAVRGGSWASRDEHCRTDHRNAYRPEGRWSHVGFRTVAP